MLSALPPAIADALREPTRAVLATGAAALSLGALASAALALNSASSARTRHQRDTRCGLGYPNRVMDT